MLQLKRSLLSLTALMMLTPTASAASETCVTTNTTIAFVNGILNDETMSGASMSLLKKAYQGIGSDEDESVEFKLYWNYGQKVGVSKTDIFQTVLNKALQEGAITNSVGPALLASIIAKYIFGDSEGIGSLPQGARDALLKIFNDSDLFKAQIETGIDGAVTDTVLTSTAAIKTQAISDLTKGNRVILVTHSQGNFYGKEAYRQITSERPEFVKSLGMTGVASVTRSIPGGGSYVTYANDLVVGGVLIADPLTLLPNRFYDPVTYAKMLFADFTGHNFANTYMNRLTSMPQDIVNNVKDTRDRLQVAEGNDGPITATLTWDINGDVDLHTYEPNGSHIYYGNRSDASSAGYLDRDDVIGRGPEHYYTDCQNVQLGKYTFGLNYYEGRGPRTAQLVVAAVGQPSQALTVTLPAAEGSDGDDTPALLFDVVLSRETSGKLKAAVSRR